MTLPVFLNGRFLRQPVTGVQRFSAEITAAIDRLVGGGEWPETVILSPRDLAPDADGRRSPYQRLLLREVGRRGGHIWEQIDLPSGARGGVLINLGNTAPILSGRRQIVVIHDAGVFDTPESYSFRFRTWYKTLQRGLVWSGVQIVTVSEFSRHRLAARLGLDPRQIAVMYEGADHILRAPSDLGTLERYGLYPRKFALVVASRVAHKNLEGLREAAAALDRRGVAIAVAGASNQDVFRDIRRVDFAERRLGRVTDAELRTLYENAVCLLFPSLYEGFGLPPVEAMTCACPVLAASGGAVEEICGNGALYFENGNGKAISDTVERFLDEAGLADRLRACGEARAKTLSWDSSARILGDVVRRMQAQS